MQLVQFNGRKQKRKQIKKILTLKKSIVFKTYLTFFSNSMNIKPEKLINDLDYNACVHTKTA